MTITATIQAAFTAIVTANSDLACTVKYRRQTATGLRVLVDKQTQATEYGHAGTNAFTVRVREDQIDEPERGAHVVINDKQVYVLGCRTSGGLRVLVVSETQPVEGV